MERANVWQIEVVKSRAISIIIGISSLVMLMAFGAWVKIPIPGTPVPITLQTMFVLLGGAILGGYGGLAQLIYIILGAMGVPIFACGLGLSGPTGGYLIGFVVSAFVIGSMVRVKRNLSWIIFSMIIGTIIIYLFGALQLGLFLPTEFKSVVALGILPFVPGDILKLFIASLVYYKFQAKFAQIFNI